MVRFRSYSQFALARVGGWKWRHEPVQTSVSTFGPAQMHPGGDAFDRERCLLAQPCGQCQLARITLAPGGQFGPTANQPAEFLADNPLRLRLGQRLKEV